MVEGISFNTILHPLLVATLLLLLIGSLVVSVPYYPGSEITQEKNDNGFLAVTIVGSILIVVGVFVGWKYVYSNSEWLKNNVDDFWLRRIKNVEIMD